MIALVSRLFAAFGTLLLVPGLLMAFPADFDGDGLNDLVVFREAEGNWYVYPSSFLSTGSCPPCFTAIPGGCVKQWGLPGDVPISGDYDGDGRADVTIWRKSTQTWWITFSSFCGSASVPIGATEDLPDEGDFNGDGVSDIMLYRPSTSFWYLRSSIPSYPVTSYFTYVFPSTQDPVGMVSGNYRSENGGVNADAARYIGWSNNGTQWRGSWLAITPPVVFGTYQLANIILGPVGSVFPADFIPVAGNYGGVAANFNDLVLWYRPTGEWTIRYSGGAPSPLTVQWGASVDLPVGGDFDGDSIADITVFRNSYVFGWGGTWFFIPSSGSCPAYATPFSQPPVSVACYKQWGLPGDVPVG